MRRIYHARLSGAEPPPPVAERERVILHVGHRAERKGQHLLVQAFARVASAFPKWRLCLVGPPGDAAFERSLQELAPPGRVEILGSQTDVAERMQRAAIYVQPSLQEALGLALQEALWHGCAGVGTRVGGIPELIEDGVNGLLVAAGDVPALAAALERLLREAPLRARLGAAGPAAIRRRGMTAEEMTRQHRELYHSLLHG